MVARHHGLTVAHRAIPAWFVMIAGLAALSVPARSDDCALHVIGITPDLANTSSGLLHNGIGETFIATDSLITSLTVWRAASEDSAWNVGLRPYFMGTDSTGMPDRNQILSVGPTLIIPNGDGVHPIEFKWTFDPPVVLPAPGKYAFYLFQDPCGAWFDVISNKSAQGQTYPDGVLWDSGRSWGCTPTPWSYPYDDADVIFRMEFCDTSTTPTRASSWGDLKVRYR